MIFVEVLRRLQEAVNVRGAINGSRTVNVKDLEALLEDYDRVDVAMRTYYKELETFKHPENVAVYDPETDGVTINGKDFNGLLGVVGLSIANDEVTSFEPSYGWDGGFEETGTKFERADKIVLADTMIKRWIDYKTKVQDENL